MPTKQFGVGFDAATTPLDGTETLSIVQGGVTVDTTTQDIADLAGAGSGTVTSVGWTYGSSLSDILSVSGSPITTSGSFTASAVDPNADRIVFWDDSASKLTYLTVGSGLSLTGTTLEATGAGSGDVVGPGSATDNALARFDATTGKLIQNSGVLVTDDNEISGYKGSLNQQTGTTYTLTSADSGKIVELTNAASIALTADPALPKGFACTIVQGGAGQVTVASTGSGSVVNRQSQFKTAGTNAMCAIYVRSNSGSNAVFVFGGDTSA